MRRRDFIKVGVTISAWPFAAAKAQNKIYKIGILETIPAAANRNYRAFVQGLTELGYVDGKNLRIEYRSADGHNDRFPALAGELVTQNADLIVTRGTPAVLAAKKATTTIPIVMAAIGEPLIAVSAIAHPGGNVTGLSAFVTDLQAKRVELLKNLVPQLSEVGALMNMGNPVLPPQWIEIERAARSMGLKAKLLDVRTADDLKSAFEKANADHIGALVVSIDTLTQSNRQLIAALAIKHRLPAIFASREFVQVGGLLTYGPSYQALYHRAASYADRIFKGAKPGDLPIEQPTQFELVINQKTANAIGLAIPETFLLRADEVIE